MNFLRIAFLQKTSGGCFWQSNHSTVKTGWVFLIWFRAFTCFQTWSKAYAKRCTNNFLLSGEKQFFSCLNYFINCFRFQNMFWRNIPRKHFRVVSTLFLGWYDIAKSHNVKLTLKQRCVHQHWNSQCWTTSNQRCTFQRWLEQDFNIFYYSWMFVNKLFTYLTCTSLIK